MIKILSKILIILQLAILLLNMSAKSIYAAVEIAFSKAYMQKIGEADYHLKYYREDRDIYTYLICSIVGYYDENKNFNPSYCMNKDLTGAENESYYVKIDSLLKNDAVWRVIKNGYPYKSAKEMGLENKYNAYAVTKWAVYCILGESELKNFKAESDDKEAVAMLAALKNLVKIGQNGTEKQNDNPLTIVKSGDLIDEGENYTQTYVVNSTTDFSSYKILNNAVLPKGAFISNENGVAQSIFKKDEKFKIIIPKISLEKDINIDVTISAECKSYVILEGKTTVTKTQNYVLTAGEYATATAKTNLKFQTNTGKIKLYKVDKDNKKPISGVEFNLKNLEGKIISTKTTNENGIIEFTGFYSGKYTLEEIKTKDEYDLLENIIEVDVRYNETEEVSIENNHKKGNLKIYKVDKDNNEIKLSNVEFDLYSEEEKSVIGTYITNESGEIYIENLRTGKYKIIEKTTDKWHNLADEINVEVKSDEITETKIENELKKGKIKVIKVDKDDNDIKLEGVEFKVLDKDGNELERIVTNKNGEAVSKEYVIRDFETIYLQEVKTKNEYVLNTEKIEIKLKENDIVEMQIENEKIKGKIKIIKTSKEESLITGEKAGTYLEGVEFEIYNEDDKLVEKIKTDNKGIAITSDLEKGIYKVKETKTKKYYYLDEKVRRVEIKENGDIVELNILNEPQNPEINIEKNGQDKAEIGTEIQYDISVRNTGNTILNNFIWIDKIPVDYITVTKFKTGTYNQDLQYNVYYKTNINEDEYILLMEGLSTKENYEIDFFKELADNEYVTELKLDFGTVDIGFCSNENPNITAKVKEEVKSESTFVNTASVSGDFEDIKVTDNSKWKTFVYKLLPKTGF